MNYGGERTSVAEEEKNTREQANSDPGKSVLFSPFRVWKMIITPTHSSIPHFASHVLDLCLSRSRFDGVRRPRAARVEPRDALRPRQGDVLLRQGVPAGGRRREALPRPRGRPLGGRTANLRRCASKNPPLYLKMNTPTETLYMRLSFQWVVGCTKPSRNNH